MEGLDYSNSKSLLFFYKLSGLCMYVLGGLVLLAMYHEGYSESMNQPSALN
jgi:hypothetical protein